MDIVTYALSKKNINKSIASANLGVKSISQNSEGNLVVTTKDDKEFILPIDGNLTQAQKDKLNSLDDNLLNKFSVANEKLYFNNNQVINYNDLKDITLTVDDTFNTESKNAISNRAITEKINNLQNNITQNTTNITTLNDKTDIIKNKTIKSMVFSNKKIVYTFYDDSTQEINLSNLSGNGALIDLSDVDSSITLSDGMKLVYNLSTNKWIPTVDDSSTDILNNAKSYTDNQIANISKANATTCETKPSASEAVANTWYYYQEDGIWKQTIYIGNVEVTIDSGDINLTNYVNKTDDITSTYTGTETDTSKIPDINSLNALKALIDTSIALKLNISDIIDNLISEDTDKALSANQGKKLNDRLQTVEKDYIDSTKLNKTLSEYTKTKDLPNKINGSANLDDELSIISENGVKNKVITNAINSIDNHSHNNKDILDKLSVNDEDKLLYNGNKIGNDVVATKDTLGIVRIGNGLKVDNGVVSFDGSNYYTKTQIDNSFATITTVEELKKRITDSGSASSLKEYDNTATYSTGDLCIYDGNIYKCIQDITVAENFDISKWEKIVSGDIPIVGLDEW